MENTLENKARLFAQYWGQKVYNHFGDINNKNEDVVGFIRGKLPFWLELTSLSNITDKECKHLNWNRYALNFPNFNDIESYEADYLRSRGYAMPFCGLSVEQQIEYGWVKLRTKEHFK